MPTLNRRVDDGGYYIRHRYMDHNTWQVTGVGVHFLNRRYVSRDGQLFSRDLFMELLRLNLVYYGDEMPPADAPRWEVAQQPAIDRLRQRGEMFYRLVFGGKLIASHDVLHKDTDLSGFEALKCELDTFAAQLRQFEVKTWRLVDARVYSKLIDEDIGVTYDVGATYVLLRLARHAADTPLEYELRQSWLGHNNEWWLLSGAFQLPDTA